MGGAIGDFVGFDGEFGYDGLSGPNGAGRQLSLGNLGDAFTGGGGEAATRTTNSRTDPSDEFTNFLFGDDGSETLNLRGLDLDQNNPFRIVGPGIGDGITPVGYELYDPSGFDRLSLFERALIGMDAHRVLTDIARSEENGLIWFADVSIVQGDGLRFVGRVDLGFREGREIWELKPDNIGAITIGEEQVIGYALSQYDTRDIPGILEHRIADPYRVAQRSPQAAGLVGFVEGDAYPGRYGSYTYRYAGNGVIAYTWHGSNFASFSLEVTRAPWWFWVPGPGGRDNRTPAY